MDSEASAAEYPDATEVSIEFGNLYQQGKILMYSLAVERPQMTFGRLQGIFPKVSISQI